MNDPWCGCVRHRRAGISSHENINFDLSVSDDFTFCLHGASPSRQSLANFSTKFFRRDLKEELAGRESNLHTNIKQDVSDGLVLFGFHSGLNKTIRTYSSSLQILSFPPLTMHQSLIFFTLTVNSQIGVAP